MGKRPALRGMETAADNRGMTSSSSGFASLSLPAHVLANLQQLGYLRMTPIQAAALPVALLGKDLIAQA